MCVHQIADFGVSEEIERTESNLSRYAGTPAFVAPECLDGECICMISVSIIRTNVDTL